MAGWCMVRYTPSQVRSEWSWWRKTHANLHSRNSRGCALPKVASYSDTKSFHSLKLSRGICQQQKRHWKRWTGWGQDIDEVTGHPSAQWAVGGTRATAARAQAGRAPPAVNASLALPTWARGSHAQGAQYRRWCCEHTLDQPSVQKHTSRKGALSLQGDPQEYDATITASEDLIFLTASELQAAAASIRKQAGSHFVVTRCIKE